MNIDELRERLEQGEVVVVPREQWDRLERHVEVVEDHDTQMSGRLLVIGIRGVVAAVESPKPGERVVRPLDDIEAARAFVEDRLDTYERMWDGCGCKVDYYR